jgi:hypothetical protein
MHGNNELGRAESTSLFRIGKVPNVCENVGGETRFFKRSASNISYAVLVHVIIDAYTYLEVVHSMLLLFQIASHIQQLCPEEEVVLVWDRCFERQLVVQSLEFAVAACLFLQTLAMEQLYTSASVRVVQETYVTMPIPTTGWSPAQLDTVQ